MPLSVSLLAFVFLRHTHHQLFIYLGGQILRYGRYWLPSQLTAIWKILAIVIANCGMEVMEVTHNCGMEDTGYSHTQWHCNCIKIAARARIYLSGKALVYHV